MQYNENMGCFFSALGVLLLGLLVFLGLTACGKVVQNPYEGKQPADISGYETMADYTGKVMLTDTTVKEIVALMEEGRTFVFFSGFDTCPWCNRLLPYLNEAAIRAGVMMGYLDTRKNPAWNNNMDIDNYDLFASAFEEELTKYSDGRPHLYVPDLYFIRNGALAARHQGVLEGLENPKNALTEEQIKRLGSLLDEYFALLK